MSFFLRYTSQPVADLERGESYHASGMSQDQCSVEEIAEMFGCSQDDIVLLDNGLFNNGKENNDLCYFQKLGGLCGFELSATTEEDAIAEAKEFYYNNVYNSKRMGDLIAIFEGDFVSQNEEGVLFSPSKYIS